MLRLLKNFYQLAKVSGFYFCSHNYDLRGIAQRSQTVDTIVFIFSVLFSIYSSFVDYKIDFETLLNSAIIHELANNTGKLSVILTLTLKISLLFFSRKLTILLEDLRYCGDFVSSSSFHL